MLVCTVFTTSCEKDKSGGDKSPKINIKAGVITENSVTFQVSPEDATECCYSVVKSDLSESLKDAEYIFKNPVLFWRPVPFRFVMLTMLQPP